MSCVETLVKIPSAGFQLAGVLHLPVNVSKPKPVLFLHGFTGSKTEAGRLFTDMARVLCSAGYASLRFDFRGHGDSPLSFEEFRISTAVEDAQNAASHLKSLGEVDASRLAVIGLSMGGGVAVKTVAGRDDVAALVLLSAAFHFPDLVVLVPLRQEGGYVYLREGTMRMKAENWLEHSMFSVMHLADQVRAPTLFIHAVDDEPVPINHARKFYEKLNVEKRFVEVRGGHVFSDYHVRRQVESEVLAWIKQHL